MMQKKPRFCFIVAKMVRNKTERISPETLPETSEQNICTNVASEQFFSGKVILPKTSLEMSEQNFCTNVASEQFFRRSDFAGDLAEDVRDFFVLM
jgi:hypothetical protein